MALSREQYLFGVYWIAENDDAGDTNERRVAGLLTVALLSDMAEVSSKTVARDVVSLRKKR